MLSYVDRIACCVCFVHPEFVTISSWHFATVSARTESRSGWQRKGIITSEPVSCSPMDVNKHGGYRDSQMSMGKNVGKPYDYHRWWDVVLPYFHTHAGRCLATNAELYPAGQGSPSFLQVCKVSKVNHLLFFLPAYLSSNWWWLLNPGEKPQIPVHFFVVLKQPGDESMLFVLHQVLKKLYRVRSGLYRLYLCIYFIHIYDISICMSWCNVILHHISQGWW